MIARPNPADLSGIDLSRAFYFEEVRPILDRNYAGMVHSAGLLGYSSEVLGLDDHRSRDHNWGPRVRLFVADGELGGKGDIDEVLARELPVSFMGWSTNFGAGAGVWNLVDVDAGPVNHHVEIFDPGSFFAHHLGFDPRQRIEVRQWLAVPTQRLLEVTAGAVFHDGLEVLGPSREVLAWYPDDVWKYLLACQWMRISQEEAFVGRTSEVGDDIGSRIAATRLVRDIIRLWFLLERRYTPYAKWLGTAFSRLPPPAELTKALSTSLATDDPLERNHALAAAYEIAGQRTNSLEFTVAVDPTPRNYYGRPFPVIHGERFAAAIHEAIDDELLRHAPLIGGVDQFIDNTDILSVASRSNQVVPDCWH